MRRMITEKDVEKLDSIKPSEIEKLGAMQDPKEARANQVLTADGTGKATYKDSKTGAIIGISSGGAGVYFTKPMFTANLGSLYKREDFPGYAIAKGTFSKAIAFGFNSLPYYTKSDGSKVYVSPDDFFFIKGLNYDIIFGVKQAVYDKFVADTPSENYASFYTGKYDQIKFE